MVWLNLVKLLRPAHWLKNLFVLAPIFFSGTIDHSNILMSIIGFIIFGLLSSTIYIFNDWCDIEADRQHMKKKLRPLASGSITPRTAIAVKILLLLLLGFLLHIFSFELDAILLLSGYFLINLLYSLGLKHISVIELMLVSSGFVIRLLFGAVIIQVELSIWIMICTGLLSTLIVIGKRRGDLVQENDKEFKRRSLQGYNVNYLDYLLTIFSGCTITSYLLFCASPYAVEKFGLEVLWTSIFVILGIAAYLKVLVVDKSGEDPVKILLTNHTLQSIVIAWVASFILVMNY